ncbi:hypothetical protein OCOL_000884 [Ordospora colligata]|uniref:Uncharacterized protein n=1 Tax=Ordospora colligata OC4 TaxID=1354746 RepID=A0A0B2UJ90_9MICR|nr:uncharacterized protein M896_081530 [Ordospora colligata OC4]KHN69413.1 hypothetical protein M896_081530 [Ordospora colligata OC4]TBU14927.1 hypothetical protein CWI41_081520 [Ordospora colligata]TBU15058.1 hypothetical protein CWI40_081540 [Ordospora colligata]
MRGLHVSGIISIMWIIIAHASAVHEFNRDDESTVEIVLLNDESINTQQRHSQANTIRNPKKNTDKASKDKALRDLLTILLGRILTEKASVTGSKSADEPHLNSIQTNKDTQIIANNKDITQHDKEVSSNDAKTRIEMLKSIEHIPMNYNLLCTFFQNIGFIRDKLKNKPGIGVVRNVIVYDNGNQLIDYWSRLVFKEQAGRLIDETGYFEGIKVSKFEDVLKDGKMTVSGLIQKRDISSMEALDTLNTIKLLLNEVANEKKIPLHNLINESCTLSTVEEVVFYAMHPSINNEESAYVCICSDSFCKEPCKEVILMKKKDIVNRNG